MVKKTEFKCLNEYACLACSFFGKCKLREREEYERQNKEWLEKTLWYKCINKNKCATCPDNRECLRERKLPYKKFKPKNVIINVFPDSDKIEVLHYKKAFLHMEESENLDEVDRERMLKLNEQGIYEPIKDDFTIQALQRSIRNATKRSKDSFYGFAKSNDWEYFITLTYSPEIVNRYDDLAVKELWSEFQRWCVRRSSDVKMLIIPERHEDGAIHFHGLVANINFNLECAFDPHTKKPLCSSTGAPLFNIMDWKNGMSTLAVIPKEDNYEAVVNYMEKYISKDGNIGYCQKRYYRTRNLEFKNKSIFMFDSDEELTELVQSLVLEAIKDNDKMTVYRKKKESTMSDITGTE